MGRLKGAAALVICVAVTVADAGILHALRERMARPGPTNRNLGRPGPGPATGAASPFLYMVDDGPMNGGPAGGPSPPFGAASPLDRFGSYGGGPGGVEGGPSDDAGSPVYNYEDGPIDGSEAAEQPGPRQGGGGGGGPGSVGPPGVVSSQQLQSEFAEADGVSPQEAGANDDDEDFDFDNDSAQNPVQTGRQQKKSDASNRRKGVYNGYRYASPNSRSKSKPQFAQERQNNPDGDREPAEFFPYREFGEQPDRDAAADYAEYGDYTENLEGPAGDGPEGGRGQDPDLDIDRPRDGAGRDPAFDFDYDEERGERDGPEAGDGLRGGGGGGGGGGPPFPGFGPDGPDGADDAGERDEVGDGASSDDRILSDGDEPPSPALGGNGGRGSFFGLRNRGSGGRPGGSPGGSRFSLFSALNRSNGRPN